MPGNLREGQPLAPINVGIDGNALPGWATHFGSTQFARSAVPFVSRHVEEAVPVGPVRVVALGAANAHYERTVTGDLQRRGYSPTLVVSDMQKASLADIPAEPFPVVTMLGDSTQLQLGSVDHPTVVLSRALEHYLSEPEFVDLMRTAHGLIGVDGLYMPQISSGDPLALRAFAAALTSTVGKAEHFLTVDEYRKRVSQATDAEGRPLLEEFGIGAADSQIRGARELGRRYVPEFINTHAEEFAPAHRGRYEAEARTVTTERDRLGKEVAQGRDREEAIAELDEVVGATGAYIVYRNRYLDTIAAVWGEAGYPEGRGLEWREGQTDAGITVEYPIFGWKRAPSTGRS